MRLTSVITCAFAIPLSAFGFSNLIGKVYPIFGYAGLFLIFAIVLHAIKLPFNIKSKNR